MPLLDRPPTAGTPPAGGGAQTPQQPFNPATLGAPMYPWLLPYQGNFTAPMSPYQNQALEGLSGFMQNLPGAGGGGGSYGGGSSAWNTGGGGSVAYNPPDFAPINAALKTIKEQEDAEQLQQIASSMAAGGNALSGARLASEQQYGNRSNADFEAMIGQLMQRQAEFGADVGLRNRALDVQRSGIAAQSAAQRAQNQLAQQQLGMAGWGQLMEMGGMPQQLEQQDLNSQYRDYIRQVQGMQGQYNLGPTLAALTMGQGYPGSHYAQQGASDFEKTAALLSMLGGGGGGGLGNIGGQGLISGGNSGYGWAGDLYKALFGGGGQSPAENWGQGGYVEKGYDPWDPYSSGSPGPWVPEDYYQGTPWEGDPLFDPSNYA